MSDNSSGPDLMNFARWLAKGDERGISHYATQPPSALLVAAARRARDEYRGLAEDLGSGHEPVTTGSGEVLQLLAAADASDAVLPPELTTASGFRVTLAHEIGAERSAATLCVLVRCPTGLIESIEGQIACLCRGAERFELGQFDSEGKALGTLPASVDIALSDFSRGDIRLEVLPRGPSDE